MPMKERSDKKLYGDEKRKIIMFTYSLSVFGLWYHVEFSLWLAISEGY